MRQFPRGWRWPLEVFFPGARSKIGELFKTNSVLLSTLSVTLLFSRCFKAKTIVFIDDPLLAVS